MKESKTYSIIQFQMSWPSHFINCLKKKINYQDQTRVDSNAVQVGNAGGFKVAITAVVHSRSNLNLIGTPRSKHMKARILVTENLPLTFWHMLCGRFSEITVIWKVKSESFHLERQKHSCYHNCCLPQAWAGIWHHLWAVIPSVAWTRFSMFNLTLAHVTCSLSF